MHKIAKSRYRFLHDVSISPSSVFRASFAKSATDASGRASQRLAFWLHLAAARSKLREDGPVPKDALPPFRSSSSGRAVAVSCFFVVGSCLPPFFHGSRSRHYFFGIFFVFVVLPPLAALRLSRRPLRLLVPGVSCTRPCTREGTRYIHPARPASSPFAPPRSFS